MTMQLQDLTTSVADQIIPAALFVLGLYWCKEVIGRLPKDISEFKQSQGHRNKLSIAFFWALTLGILYWMFTWLWSVIAATFVW